MPQLRKFSQKPLIAIVASIAGVSLLVLSYNHYKTAHLLDEASKELLVYDALNSQGNSRAQALYHLSKAANKVDHISSNSISLPTVHQLKLNLQHNTQNRLQGEFIPSLTNELEQAITNPSNTPIVRYKALKIYLMLAQPEHLVATEVQNWFTNQWKGEPANRSQNQLTLLTHALSKPLQGVLVKQQIISDARNYLNALPTSYLYYSIAKEFFPLNKQKLLFKDLIWQLMNYLFILQKLAF